MAGIGNAAHGDGHQDGGRRARRRDLRSSSPGPGSGKTRGHRRARRPPDRRGAGPAGRAARPHLLAQGGRRPARADRCAPSTQLRELPGHDVPRVLLRHPDARRSHTAAAGSARGTTGMHESRARRRSATSGCRPHARCSRRRCASPSSATTIFAFRSTTSRWCASATSPRSAARGELDYGGLQRESVALLEQDSELAPACPRALPLHPRRRVPGHERRAGATPRAASPANARTSSASLTRTSRSTASVAQRSTTRSASTSAGRARVGTTCRSTTARPRRSSISQQA